VVSRRVFGMVEPWVEGNSLEELHLKEFNHPVLAVEILRWREEAEEVEVAAAEAPWRLKQEFVMPASCRASSRRPARGSFYHPVSQGTLSTSSSITTAESCTY
jgi:hypothetical protein